MRVLVPLPDHDFDPTEVAVPWHYLTHAGHEVVFATEGGGLPPQCDPKLLSGVLFGRLGAEPAPIAMYESMTRAPQYHRPSSWSDISVVDFGGLVLPGGHAPGMRQYLGSTALQHKVAEFWALGRPVGAICHGVLVLARSTDAATGRSVIAHRFTTCLPKYMERTAFLATAWKLGRYYRTSPAYVEDEVRAALDGPSRFVRGPFALRRGTALDDSVAFSVRDGNYLSARWPGDAYLFAKTFQRMLSETPVSEPAGASVDARGTPVVLREPTAAAAPVSDTADPGRPALAAGPLPMASSATDWLPGGPFAEHDETAAAPDVIHRPWPGVSFGRGGRAARRPWRTQK